MDMGWAVKDRKGAEWYSADNKRNGRGGTHAWSPSGTKAAPEWNESGTHAWLPSGSHGRKKEKDMFNVFFVVYIADFL